MNKALVYHTIDNPHEPFAAEPEFSPERFESHLRWLSKRRERVVRLRRFLSAGEGENLFAVTFDNSPRSDLAVALPLLEKYDIPMTLFIVAGYIGEEDYLNAAELKELAAHPLITIGSQGLWHRPLTCLTDDEARYELSESRRRIEGATGSRTDLFAYPYGDCDGRIERLCLRAGYAGAWSTWNGLNSPFSRGRIPVDSGDSLPGLLAKISPLYCPVRRWFSAPRVEFLHENFVLHSNRQGQWS